MDISIKRSIPIGTQFKINSKISNPLLLSFIGISRIDGNLLFELKNLENSFNDYFLNKEDEVLIENSNLSFYVINPQALGAGLDPNIYNNQFNDRFSNTKIY